MCAASLRSCPTLQRCKLWPAMLLCQGKGFCRQEYWSLLATTSFHTLLEHYISCCPSCQCPPPRESSGPRDRIHLSPESPALQADSLSDSLSKSHLSLGLWLSFITIGPCFILVCCSSIVYHTCGLKNPLFKELK